MTDAARGALAPRFTVIDRGHVDLRDRGIVAVHWLIRSGATTPAV
jgi:hypothetical protein